MMMDKQNMPNVHYWRRFIATFFVAIAGQFVSSLPALAQTSAAGSDRSVAEWLLRMHDASKNRAYQGTFVVTSPLGMSSAKIWHACTGTEQYERVETLTGPQRSTLRHNQNVITFMPETRTARTESRETLGFFAGGPGAVGGVQAGIGDYYQAKTIGSERVAGLDADVVQLSARDSLRFGYRVWSEKKTGLVVKLQTLDEANRVLEQAAFSELQLDAPVRIRSLAAMMHNTQGYKVESAQLMKTTAAAEGWSLRGNVPGFLATSCHKRLSTQGTIGQSGTPDDGMQWVFSDGMASVSLFVEAFDPKRHTQEGSVILGATHSLTRRLDAYWLTAMGEVPLATLRAFAAGLQRR